MYHWGLDETGQKFFYSRTDLESHKCTLEELGLSGSDHKFWKINKYQESSLNRFQNSFICLDQKDLQIYGEFTTTTGSNIYIDVVKCDGKEVACKSDEEIRNYFAEKSLVILTNRIRFDFEKYGEVSIVKESEIKWLEFGLWQNR